MTKLRLGIFAIMAISLMMGTSIFMVHAAKPEVVSYETSVDFCGFPLCKTDPNPNPVCGVTGTVVEFDITLIKTNYGQDKFRLDKSINGVVYADASLSENIGSIKSSTTTNGHYEKNGATVLKIMDKVQCSGGVDDIFIHEVEVTNNGKTK